MDYQATEQAYAQRVLRQVLNIFRTRSTVVISGEWLDVQIGEMEFRLKAPTSRAVRWEVQRRRVGQSVFMPMDQVGSISVACTIIVREVAADLMRAAMAGE